MPNHVTTSMLLTGSPSDIDAFVAKFLTVVDLEEGKNETRKTLILDFEKIIPMPTEIEATSCSFEDARSDKGFQESRAIVGMQALGHSTVIRMKKEFMRYTDAQATEIARQDPMVLRDGQIMLNAWNATGCLTWYDWSIENWGTKWGSYNNEIDRISQTELCVKFDTAWSVAEPILRAVHAAFPNVAISGSSFDEGWCFGCRFQSKDGLVLFGYHKGDDDVMRSIYAEAYGYAYVDED